MRAWAGVGGGFPDGTLSPDYGTRASLHPAGIHLRHRLRILPEEGTVGIDDQPGGGAQGAEAGGGQEGSSPTKVVGQHGCQDCGNGASQLGSHIYETGKRTGGASAQISG